METKCDICTFAQKDGTILTSDHWVVNLANDQGYIGRSYIVLKDHKGTLSDLSEAEWQDFTVVVKRLENACKQGLGASLVNWSCLMNNAFRTSPANPHIHWHFRPRYRESVKLNGIEFTDPEFGEHYNRDHRFTADDITQKHIVEKIKQNL